ncbi:Ras family protein [Trichomonas vaginalis G3]|uniref:Ras family protein n=1 Tax=Trichomonas vaginalis (strain ATCC PRA-98 / G3) TaxID=412133 RepID=A2FSW8_TRIV3|nr:regulation of endocytosis [Trichomonas vaginalis G3]EAX91990.1 Ras family protein [Trichomonas vaginalis G3]KAI5528945.1 regulation of endocytosis [Trichomonas vaginalis G3]|eukprot:XP_001304920.1 Ras family protein [Trichomonas vaginalis G3]
MGEEQLTFKFILVGDSGVGKTSMCKMFCENIFEENQTQTIGLEFSRRTVDIKGNTIKIQFWDTAGQERFRSITKSYFHSAAAVFVVYDVSNRNSFNSVGDWINDAVNLSPPNSVKVMIGNKTDLLSKREVPFVEANDLATQHNFAYYETSALSGDKLEETFLKTAEKVYNTVSAFKIDSVSLKRDSIDQPLDEIVIGGGSKFPCC